MVTRAALTYLLLSALAIFMLFPFLWLVVISIQKTGGVFGFPPNLIPLPATLKHYAEIWRTSDPSLPRLLVNSIFITGTGVFANILLAALAAYPLARMRFWGRNFIFFAILATLMIPSHVGLIVNFITLKNLGLINTYAGVILPSAVSVFGIFLLRQGYLSIPQELEDAARIDGAGEFTIWRKIMTPLVLPQIATLAIFEFVAFWNSFLWPLIVLKSPDKYPLAVGLLYLQGIFGHNTRLVAAGAVILAAPIIGIFLVFQKYFIRGITAGAVQ